MSRRRWTRPTLTSARDWGSHGRRDNDEQRAAGVSTATRGAVHPGQLAAGAAPGRAQRRGAHESVSLRAALQAQHRRASASIPGPTQDRRGAGVAGGPDGADRRDRAVGGFSDAESLHDDVSACHRYDAERVPQQQCPDSAARSVLTPDLFLSLPRIGEPGAPRPLASAPAVVDDTSPATGGARRPEEGDGRRFSERRARAAPDTLRTWSRRKRRGVAAGGSTFRTPSRRRTRLRRPGSARFAGASPARSAATR